MAFCILELNVLNWYSYQSRREVYIHALLIMIKPPNIFILCRLQQLISASPLVKLHKTHKKLILWCLKNHDNTQNYNHILNSENITSIKDASGNSKFIPGIFPNLTRCLEGKNTMVKFTLNFSL